MRIGIKELVKRLHDDVSDDDPDWYPKLSLIEFYHSLKRKGIMLIDEKELTEFLKNVPSRDLHYPDSLDYWIDDLKRNLLREQTTK